MHRPTLFTLLASTWFLASCSTSPKETPYSRGEMWIGDAIQQASLDRAIVAERTLYPFHFATGTSELNDLGKRDLRVLAKHVARHGGAVHLHRGSTTDEVYAARAQAVEAALEAEGVAPEQASVVDEAPQGPGIPAHRAASDVAREPLGESQSSTAVQAQGRE
jgi:hypothetical protein